MITALVSSDAVAVAVPKLNAPEPSVLRKSPSLPSLVGRVNVTPPDTTFTAPVPFAFSSNGEFDALVDTVLSVIVTPSTCTDVRFVSAVSRAMVIVLPEPLVVMFAPPETCKVSLSRSMFNAVESSVAKSRSCAVICESTYVLIALADAKVSSDPETLVKSVSNTPDFKSATSMFEMLLPVPSTSNVLLVSVSVELAVKVISLVKAKVPAELGKVTVTSAVLEGPCTVTPFVPLSVPSRNLMEPPALLLPAPITMLCPVDVVVVAATVVILSVPSTSIVTFPVPLSATVTLLFPCDMVVVENAPTSEST